MKTISKIILSASLLLFPLFFASCSKDRAASREDLLALSSSEYDLVACINFSKLLDNAGDAADLSGFHDRDAAVFRAISRAEGLIRDDMLVLKGNDPVAKATIVFRISNDELLKKSLGKSCDIEQKNGITRFAPAKYGDCLASDGSFLWVLPHKSPRELAQIIDHLRKKAEKSPLSEQIRAKFDPESTLAAFGKNFSNPLAPDSRLNFFASAKLDKQAIHILYSNTDAEGNPCDFFTEPASGLKDLSSRLDPDGMISLAVTLPDASLLRNLIATIDSDLVQDENISQALNASDGRFALSAGLSDPTSTDLFDTNLYRLSLFLGAQPGKSSELLRSLADYASDMLPLKSSGDGYAINDGSRDLLRMKPLEQAVLIETPSKPSASPVTNEDFDRLIAIGTVNIPSNVAVLNLLDIDFGTKIDFKATNRDISLNVTVTDTSMTLTECVLKLIKIFG